MLSIIVISFNTREMTLACLRSVFAETKLPFELIVLDNASSDGSAKAIEMEFGEQVRLIVSAENLGFAAGNNRAIEEATGEYLLLLNPDTLVLDEAVDHLFEFAVAHPDAGIWGGRTLFGDRSLNPASCWSKQTLWSLLCQALGLTSLFRRSSIFNPEGMGGWDRSGDRAVDIVSGCFFLLKRQLWNDLNGFHPAFFMYGEEADLCLRAHKYGAKPMVTSKATIVHYGGASETVRADKLVRLLKAKMRLVMVHFPAYSCWLGRVLLAMWPFSRAGAHWVLTLRTRQNPNKSAIWMEVVRRRAEWWGG